MPPPKSPIATMDEILDALRGLWDPWASIPAPVPYFLFGVGSRRPFSWYFEGLSRVAVSSVLELERWLHGCSYVSDKILFGREDHWQHPGEFELIRMGDCDDHALWAWRKFVEMGIPATFVSGTWREDPAEHHVWLLVTVADVEHVFESTCKVLGEALRPLEEVRDAYRPHFSVDQRFRTRAYLGTAQELLELPSSWTKTP